VQTIPFDAASASQREQAAAILVSALAHVPSAWHDMRSAREEMAISPERRFFLNVERSVAGRAGRDRLDDRASARALFEGGPA
jgi:hypothetical protein